MHFNLPRTGVRALLLFVLPLFVASCGGGGEAPVVEEAPAAKTGTLTQGSYGTTTDGKPVEQYTLTNANGMTMDVITYGGIITKLTAPDKAGNYANVVLGYDNLAQYQKQNPYFGAIIGRYGNRIAKGKFSLGGEDFTLETNDGSNHLHGGVKGFDKVVWAAKNVSTDEAPALELTYRSPDGEGGYPGNLDVKVTYTLTADNNLEISYEATTDKPTVVNLTQHSYFNLSGQPAASTILDHVLMMAADEYLPVDETLIPTGEPAPVQDTPFDFTTPKPIGQDIEASNEQLARGKGFDHCWILDNPGTSAAVTTLHHPATGRFMEVFTDEPAIQFYSGNFLDGTLPAPGGGTFAFRSGLCLETQHYPDSPNEESFPSVVLAPGETYSTTTTYRFTTK